MTCSLPTKEQVDNAVSNHKAIYALAPSQPASTTIEYLKHTAETFEKKNGFYEIKSSGLKLKTTVTTEVGKWYKRKFPIPFEKKKQEKIDQQALIGNVIHKSAELAIKRLIDDLKNLTADEALTVLDDPKLFSKYKSVVLDAFKESEVEFGYAVPEYLSEKVFLGMREIIKQIYGRQKALDVRTGNKGIVTIMSEALVIDAKEDVGGTADLIAVFSNNTAMVFDFKTKVVDPKKLNADGSIKSDATLVSKTDLERYKLQLASLSKILKKSYGIKQVISARIVPIRININFNAKSNKFDNSIKDLAIGYNQDKALQQITPLPEFTGFTDLDDFIRGIEKKIRLLKQKAEKDKANKVEYEQKIEQLEDSKKDILTFHNFNKILEYAVKIEKELTPDAVDKMSIKELREVLDELKMLESLSEATWKYRQYMKSKGVKVEDIEEFENTVSKTIASIVDKITFIEEELYNKKVSDLIEDLSNRKIKDDEGNILPFHDEGYFGKMINKLSEFENPVFIAFRKKLDSIQYDIRESVNKLIDEVQKTEGALFKYMKETGKDREWLIKSLINSNTDNLHNKLSKSFSDELKALKESKEVAKIVEYYEPKESYQKWYDDTLKTKKTDQQKKSFEERFNLTLKNGKPVQPSAWIYALLKDRNLRLKESVENNNLSQEYKYIQSVPQLKSYYEMFLKYNKQFREMLDLDYYKLPNNFIANIRRDTVERITDRGLVAGMTDSIQDMIKNLDIREDDTLFGELEDGKLVRRIPKFFINPFKDSDGNVLVGEKSYEFGKSLILFAKMAYNYKFMQEEEANILAMKEFLSERGTELIKKKGKNIEDYVGNQLARKLGNTEMENIFDTFVDMYLYGIQVQPAFGDESLVWEKRILAAKQYMTLKSLGFNFVASIGSALAAKTNSWIEGNKGILYDKQQYGEALKDAWSNREKHLALVAFFDAMNVKYENFSIDEDVTHKNLGDPTRRGFIAKYVNTRVLMRPFSYGDEIIDEIVTNAMAKNYYVDDLGNLRRFTTEEEKTKFADRTVWNLFTYENGEAKLKVTDEQLKNVIIAFRKAARSGQAKIKGTIPHEDKAYWQSQILGQVVMHYKSWMPAIMKERFGKLKYNNEILAVEMGKYTALSKEFSNVEGYAAKDFVKKIVFPKLKQFLTHLLTFGKIKMNDKARKLEYFENWLEDNPQYKGIISFEEFIDIQQRQLRSLMVELRILLAFAGIIVLLGFDWDDDGEKDYKQLWATRKLAAVIFKTNQELTFTYNPVEFAKMIANPIPMISLVTDAVKTLNNTVDETFDVIIGEERLLGGSDSDKTGLLHYSHQWIPGARGISKLFDIFNQDSGESYK